MTTPTLTPIPTAILTANGLESTSYSATSLDDAADHEPQGVYTVARTYKRDHVLLFNDHLDRLEQSAHLIGLNITLDRAALRHALRTVIDRSGYPESRFRITIPQNAPETLILSVEPFKPVPPAIIQRGARLATIQITRHNPVAKTSAWMAQRRPLAELLPPDVYQGLLMTPDGVLLEGVSANFYAILDGVLRTADEGVLPGMAQRIVFKVADGVIPVERKPITLADLPRVSEAFISSAGRHIVPVVQIDNQLIGDGKPGAQTTQLRERYNAWADAHMEAL